MEDRRCLDRLTVDAIDELAIDRSGRTDHFSNRCISTAFLPAPLRMISAYALPSVSAPGRHLASRNVIAGLGVGSHVEHVIGRMEVDPLARDSLLVESSGKLGDIFRERTDAGEVGRDLHRVFFSFHWTPAIERKSPRPNRRARADRLGGDHPRGEPSFATHGSGLI